MLGQQELEAAGPIACAVRKQREEGGLSSARLLLSFSVDLSSWDDGTAYISSLLSTIKPLRETPVNTPRGSKYYHIDNQDYTEAADHSCLRMLCV